MPAGPSATGQVMSIVRDLKTRRVDLAQPLELAVAQDRLVQITSWWACSGVSSSRLRSEPTLVATLITTASRVESIGGFVTCAKSCLK